MDKFPENFNRQNCNDNMEKAQNELIREVRKAFYDSITMGIDNCSQVISVEFPDKLWDIHRKTIIIELMERFGKLILSTNGIPGITKPVIKQSEILPNTKKVTIEFVTNK